MSRIGNRVLTIPAGVKVIDYSTFQDCVSLMSIELLEGATTINGRAFENGGA